MGMVGADLGVGRRWARPPRSGAVASRVRVVALLVGALTVLGLLVDALVRTSTDAWAAVLRPGPAEAGPLVVALTGPPAALLAAWLLCAVLVSVVAAVAGAANRPAPGRWARRLAPRALRHGVAALLGVTLLASPAAATPRAVGDGAGVAGVGRPALTAVTAAADPFDVGWRVTPPAAARPVPVTPVTPVTAPATVGSPETHGADLSPGWTPSPPAGAVARPAVPDAGTVGAERLRPGQTVASEVVVREGDTLWTLAERHLGHGATVAEICEEWPLWWAANRREIGQNPDQLRPGMRLQPPAGVATRHARASDAGNGDTTRRSGRHRASER